MSFPVFVAPLPPLPLAATAVPTASMKWLPLDGVQIIRHGHGKAAWNEWLETDSEGTNDGRVAHSDY